MLLVTPTVQEDEAGNSIELIEEVNTSADDSEKFNSNNNSSSSSGSSSNRRQIKIDGSLKNSKESPSERSMYRISMMPGVTLSASLYFKPLSVGSHNYQIPLCVLGLTSNLLFPGETWGREQWGWDKK